MGLYAGSRWDTGLFSGDKGGKEILVQKGNQERSKSKLPFHDTSQQKVGTLRVLPVRESNDKRGEERKGLCC